MYRVRVIAPAWRSSSIGGAVANRSASHEIAAKATSAVPERARRVQQPTVERDRCSPTRRAVGRSSAAPEIIVASPNNVSPPPIAAGRHQFVARTRPSTIPAQKNASHGSSGWVPLTETSNSRLRGEPTAGREQPVRASPVELPFEAPPGDAGAGQRGGRARRRRASGGRSVNSSAATTNIAP